MVSRGFSRSESDYSRVNLKRFLYYILEEVCLNKGTLSILTYLEKRKLPLTAYIFLCVYVQSCSLTCTILNTSI